jgi:hypothetical protein
MGANAALLKFWDSVLTVRRLFLNERNITILPMQLAACPLAARLQTGSSMEDDQNVLAEGFGLLGLPYAKAFSGSDHEYDGDDSPSDPEHSQERAQFMRPQRAQHIPNEIT